VALLLGQALIGWLIADLLAGTIHWLQDRVVPPGTPGLKSVIRAQRIHHIAPLAMFHGGLCKRNWSTWLVAGLGSILWLVTLGPSVIWAVATLGASLSSIVHGMAHQPSTVGTALKVLQETGLIQSPKHHAGHHRPPHRTRFCPLTDWLNPTLDALRVWERLERLLGMEDPSN
jgi:ubiquitin-conjugating enzyme E2 variant